MVIHEHNHFDIRNVGGILLEKLVIKGGNQLKARKSCHDIKEGMKWAFILEKPKALRHRAR